ncbi:MAG: hypothetical protein ABI471_12240, partial [Sphingomonas bacterium]
MPRRIFAREHSLAFRPISAKAPAIGVESTRFSPRFVLKTIAGGASRMVRTSAIGQDERKQHGS